MLLPLRASTRRLRYSLLGCLLFLVESREALSQTTPEQSFSENLIVSELVVFVDDSVLPEMESFSRKAPSDFLVLVDGLPAEIFVPSRLDAADVSMDRKKTNFDELPTVAHLVWVDADLASQSQIAAAASQLAAAFKHFPENETFSLVEVTRELVSAHRNISKTDLVLRLLALASTREAQVRPTIEQQVAALNRLATEIPTFEPADIGAMWLVVEPWSLDPAAAEAIFRQDADESCSRTALGALQRAFRIVASFGWVAFPVTVRTVGSAPALRPEISGYDKFMEREPATRAKRFKAFTWTLFRKRAREARKTPGSSVARSLEVALDVQLAPMAILARETSGSIAGDTFRVGRLAQQLRQRRRLVVRDAAVVGASLRKLKVLWTAGDGRAVPALPWLSSTSPLELGIARLLSVLQESRPLVGSPVTLRASRMGEADEPTLCFADPGKRPARRALWWDGARERIGVSTSEQTAESDGGCVQLPGGLKGSDAAVLESLNSMEWGGGSISALSRQDRTESTMSGEFQDSPPDR